MSPLLALTLALTAAGPKVEGFGMTTVGSRPALTVFVSVAVQEVRVERSGNEVTVLLAGADFGSAFAGADRFAWTMPEGPGAIQIEKRPSGVALRMSLSPDMPLDVVRQGKVIALVFGPRGSAPLAAPAPEPSPKPAAPPRPVAEAKPEPPPAPPSPAPTLVQAVPSPAPSPAAPPRAAEKRKPERPKEKAREEKAQVLTVRTTMIDTRPALTLLLSRPVAQASVERVGTEVVVSLAAELPESVPEPRVEAPLEAIRIERRPDGVALHVRVPPEVPFQVRRGETLLTVIFGEEAPGQARAEALAGQVPTEELYSQLFPAGGMAAAPAPQPGAPGAGESGSRERDALTLGPLALRPAVSVSYVNAETAIRETPQPVHDEYLQIQPAISADLGISDGRLALSYEPRLRALSSFSEVEQPSHILGASLGLPVGARVKLGATDRFVRGTLETREVDFGGEYFFNLGRFTRNALDAYAEIEMGARLGLSLGGGWNHVGFDESKGFFPYDAYSARAGVFHELTPKLRAKFDYGYSRVPRSDERPLVESTGHSVNASFNGDLSDFLSGSLSVGYLRQTSPEGGGGGQRYSGLILSGTLRHEFRPGTFAGLTLNRSTQLSSFEQNAFYVFTGGVVDVTVPLPYELVLRGAAGYQWNTYQLRAGVLAEPREDTIFGWGLGLGRPIGRRGFARADYRRDRRNSNLSGFDITSDALILQLGVGLFGSAVTSTR